MCGNIVGTWTWTCAPNDFLNIYDAQSFDAFRPQVGVSGAVPCNAVGGAEIEGNITHAHSQNSVSVFCLNFLCSRRHCAVRREPLLVAEFAWSLYVLLVSCCVSFCVCPMVENIHSLCRGGTAGTCSSSYSSYGRFCPCQTTTSHFGLTSTAGLVHSGGSSCTFPVRSPVGHFAYCSFHRRSLPDPGHTRAAHRSAVYRRLRCDVLALHVRICVLFSCLWVMTV